MVLGGGHGEPLEGPDSYHTVDVGYLQGGIVEAG